MCVLLVVLPTKKRQLCFVTVRTLQVESRLIVLRAAVVWLSIRWTVSEAPTMGCRALRL